MADDTFSCDPIWETDFQRQARLQFVETWKDRFPADRLAGLSMVWSNMRFMGCRYNEIVENLVNELESSSPICFQRLERTTKITPKIVPIIENFTIYEPSTDDVQNAVCILFESAQKSKKTISFEEFAQSGQYCIAVFIENKLIAKGEASNKKDAKRLAAENCLAVLRPRQTVIKKRKVDHDNAPTIPKTKLTVQGYLESPSIPENNVGNQLLRKMGWTGVGGIGKEGQGRVDPIIVTVADGKKGLGQNFEEKDIKRGSVRQVLMDFLNSPHMDMKFSSELEKDDRALVHTLCQQYGIKHQSHGKGEGRFLVISKQQHQ